MSTRLPLRRFLLTGQIGKIHSTAGAGHVPPSRFESSRTIRPTSLRRFPPADVAERPSADAVIRPVVFEHDPKLIGRSPDLHRGEAVGFVKVVADAEHNEIIGAHLIGPDVTELLPVLTLAQQWDLTADEVARNVFAHPTLGESVKEAVHGIAGHMINF